jgi:sulfatase-like protein
VRARALGGFGGALFALQFVVADFVLRGPGAYAARPALAIGALGSVASWGLVWSYRDRRAVRIGASVAAAAIVAIDAWVYRYYGTVLDRQVALSAMHSWADVRPIVSRLLPWVALAGIAVGLVEHAWLGARRMAWEGKARAPLAVVALLGLLGAPLEAATPDLRALSAAWLLPRSRDASAATTAEVKVLPSARGELPSVLLILTESVRASSYCSEPSHGCPFTPELDRLLPDRIPLRQMRAVASYTAVSASALFTGRTQEGSRAELVTAPTLFDYAHAVRAAGKRPVVAYWSAQSAGVLERDVRGSVDSLVSLETLLGHEINDEDDVVPLGTDRLLMDRFLRDLPSLPRPFVLVLHLAGTHAPYFVDEARAPFRPIGHVVSWSGLPALKNAYEDSVVEQDHTVAACVRAFVESQAAAPWLVLFTSDHGEAFGEHGAIHHGQNLYDEQIHVPAWVATGGGALDDAQRANLLASRDAFVTHLDVLPTVLDALGVWRGLSMVGERARLPGRSLLGPADEHRAAVPITNCTGMFPCPLDVWGMLGGDHAIEAQPWDADWNCVDLSRGEEHARGAACAALRDESRAYFPRLPNGRIPP